MADKRPTKSQAELAVALLRCYIQQPDSADTYTSAMQLLADIDTRKRAHLKRSPRWVTDHSGQHFRTGDTVTTTSGQRLQVHAVDTLAQTCLLDDGSVQDGKTLTKINPKSRTTSAASTTQTSLALEQQGNGVCVTPQVFPWSHKKRSAR